MVQPIDYMSQLQQPDISGQFIGGLQTGQAIKAQQQQKAQAEQYSADLQQYLAAPSAQGAAAMTAKYPKQREAFKQAWDIQSKDQQDANFRAGTQVYSAIQSGRPDVAAQVLDENITAMENAGQDSSALKTIRETLQRDPKITGAQIGLTLASLEPDRWAKVATEMRAAEQAPFELTEKQAKAQKAAVDANFAESMAVQDLAKKGWDIAKIQNDIGISRQNSQIAAMNAGIKRETNDLKRQELQQKIQGAQVERDAAVREKTAEIASARAGIDNSLSVIDRLLKNPELDNILGSVEGSSFYPNTLIGLVTPGADADKRADAMADLENIQSQSFLNNLMEAKAKGATFGSLTEKEGDRLINNVRNLGRKQSEAQFRDNLSETQRLLLKARGNLAERYGVPDVMPDRPEIDVQPPSSGFRVLGRE